MDYKTMLKVINGQEDKIEELESKYYKLRSELDGVYKVLEMDALDIQALQDKTFNGVTRDNNNSVNLTNKGGE